MSTNNILSKIHQEIEKRMLICDGVFERDSDTYYQGKAVAYQETLSLIDSLQQEQPSEDLEAETGRFLANVTPSFKDGSYRITRYGFRAVARHFAEWQKQQMLKDAVEANGVICKLSDRVWISPVDEEKFHQEVYDRFVVGQTVKIVIVPDKEEQK